MSSYVNFYIKDKKTKSVSYLTGYSRSSYAYNLFYETLGCNRDKDGYCAELSSEDLSNIREEASKQIRNYEKMIANYEKVKKEIGQWNNTIEEKLSALTEYESSILEAKEELEYMVFAENFYCVLQHILETDETVILAGIDCWVSKEEEEANE